jgi:hypothetical protein
MNERGERKMATKKKVTRKRATKKVEPVEAPPTERKITSIEEASTMVNTISARLGVVLKEELLNPKPPASVVGQGRVLSSLFGGHYGMALVAASGADTLAEPLVEENK